MWKWKWKGKGKWNSVEGQLSGTSRRLPFQFQVKFTSHSEQEITRVTSTRPLTFLSLKPLKQVARRLTHSEQEQMTEAPVATLSFQRLWSSLWSTSLELLPRGERVYVVECRFPAQLGVSHTLTHNLDHLLSPQLDSGKEFAFPTSELSSLSSLTHPLSSTCLPQLLLSPLPSPFSSLPLPGTVFFFGSVPPNSEESCYS